MGCISSTEKAGIHIPFMNDVKSKFMVTKACYAIEKRCYHCYVKATLLISRPKTVCVLYTLCTFDV